MLDLLLPWWPAVGGGSSAAVAVPLDPPAPVPDTVFGWPTYSDPSVTPNVTISGGSWLSALPVINALDRRFALVTRSTDAAQSSTQFIVDFGEPLPVGVLAIPKHNLTRNALVRWRGADAVDALDDTPLFDSLWRRALPEALPIAQLRGLSLTTAYVAESTVNARYWRCEIYDPDNPAGFIELGRVMLTGALRLATGIGVGARFGFVSKTITVELDSGATFFSAKPRRRSWQISLPMFTEDTAYQQLAMLLHDADVSEPVLFVFDARDPQMHLRAFSCTMRELAPLEWTAANYLSTNLQLVEQL